MTAWARPGVKCVCVRTAPVEVRIAGAVYPEVGQVYTVRKVVVFSFGPSKGEAGILLDEIVNPVDINPILFPNVHSTVEVAMGIDAFRPLITKTQEQDVALFTHHFDREGADA